MLPSTRFTLLARLQNTEDGEAWSEFVQIYQGAVYAVARRWGLQHDDALDIVQKVLENVVKQIPTWQRRQEKGGFRQWLRVATRNCLINAWKSMRHAALPMNSDFFDLHNCVDPKTVDSTLELEYRREVFQLVTDTTRHEFEDSTWRAFWLTAVEGIEPAEAAAVLGLSVGAVYIAKSRVLARLRREVSRRQAVDAEKGEANYGQA